MVAPQSWFWLVCAAVLGYGLGTVSPSALIARVRGVDIRSAGSGNPGATNAGRVLGRRFGYLVGVLDMVKGFLPALLFGLLVDPLTGMVAGVAAVLGHCTSPWLRGHGGKGVATSFGAILGIQPWWGVVGLVAFLVVFVLTRWVALGSVVASLWVVIPALIRWGHISDQLSFELLVWSLVLAGIVIFRHRRNFLGRLSRSVSSRAYAWRGLAGWLLVGATLGALFGVLVPFMPGCISTAICSIPPSGVGCQPDPCQSWWHLVFFPVAVGVALGVLVAGTARTIVVHRRAASARSSTVS